MLLKITLMKLYKIQLIEISKEKKKKIVFKIYNALTSIPSCDNNNLAISTFPDLHTICNAVSLKKNFKEN